MNFDVSEDATLAKGDVWTPLRGIASNAYRQILVRAPGDDACISAEEARGRVVKVAGSRSAGDRCYIPPEFFHYEVVGGNRRAKPGLSPFRFLARPRGVVGLSAVGPAAVEMLEDFGHRLTRIMGEYHGRPCQETVRSGYISARPVSALRAYRIHTLALQRDNVAEDHPWRRVEAPMACPDLVATLERKILTGLHRQAEMLKITIAEEPVLRIINIRRMLTIKGHTTNFAAAGVQFVSDLDLRGPWHVGHGCAKGYGEVLQQ